MMRRIVVIVIFAAILVLSSIVFYNSDDLLRLWIVYTFQSKVGRGAIGRSGASVSLGNVALSFGCGRGGSGGSESRKSVGDVAGGGGGSCWNLEMRHLRIGNAPRHLENDTTAVDWESPYAVHLNRTFLSVAGPLAYLSLLQLPIAASIFGSPSLPRIFSNGLDFIIGFRVRSMDILEIEGLSVYIEDGKSPQEDEPLNPVGLIKRGFLKKLEGKRPRHYDFVLERSRLTWYEPRPGMLEEKQQQLQKLEETEGVKGEQNGTDADPAVSSAVPHRRPKKRGSIRLFASSSVEVLGDDHSLDLELISDEDCLVLRAVSTEERDAWFDALSDAIDILQSSHGGGGNAPWLDELVAEANSRKVRWRRWERRRQQDWRRVWQSLGDNGRVQDDDDANSDGTYGEIALADGGDTNDEEDDSEHNEEDGRKETASESEDGVSKDFPTGMLLARRLNARHTKRFEDSLEWRIGLLAVRDLALRVGERYWTLDDAGWSLRGFAGSSNALRRRLRFGLGPRLLVGGVADVVSEFTGKEEYEFGDIMKTVVARVGDGVADAVSDFTGKEEYEFGDITKTAVHKVGAGVADAVQGFTGKEEYEFGDITKTVVTKVSDGLADAVSEFTRKEEYEFGDITKTAVNKVGTGVADAVQGFTGKERYEFGDVTKTLFGKLRHLRPKDGKSKLEASIVQHAEEL